MTEVALFLPFSLNPQTGTIVTTVSQEVIWANRVRIAVETTLGERVMRPSYGTNIATFLLGTVGELENQLRREVNQIFVNQLPLLDLIAVTATHDAKSNTLTAEIDYKLPNNVQTTTKVGVMVISDVNPPYQELTS